jgi:hypothetical protein
MREKAPRLAHQWAARRTSGDPQLRRLDPCGGNRAGRRLSLDASPSGAVNMRI